MANAKFEFTGKTKVHLGITLNQIRATAEFGAVAKGEIGGWIEAEANLDVSGNAWVFGNASPEEIMRLDEAREIVLAKPERLVMADWHSDTWNPTHTPEEEHKCGSAHCIAGWLQALSPDQKLREIEAQDAARQLAPVAAASGIFFVDDAMAFEWLKERRYAKPTEPKAEAITPS